MREDIPGNQSRASWLESITGTVLLAGCVPLLWAYALGWGRPVNAGLLYPLALMPLLLAPLMWATRRQYRLDLAATQAALAALNQTLELRVAHRTAELERLATTDPLTDAHNRRFLMARAEIEIAMAKRQAHAVSLVMFDIDHFKRINDSHGHNVGDRVLVALSQAVQLELRLGDTFARVGGEEFVLLLPRSDAQQASLVAERLRAMVEALHIHTGNQLVLHITASFGVATLDAHTSSVDALYVSADKALYAAKNAGRNCVVAHPLGSVGALLTRRAGVA